MTIQTVGVVGAGSMGSGIANLAASAGYHVILRDVEERFIENGLSRMNKFMSKSVEKGKITAEEKEEVMNRITTTTEVACAAVTLKKGAVLTEAKLKSYIKDKVADFKVPDIVTEIIPVNTVRVPSGLAISSRNVYLTIDEKKQAPALYQSLLLGKKLIEEGETSSTVIIKTVSSYLNKQLGETVKIDYVELLSFPELEEIAEVSRKVILAVAVQFSAARLIDNIMVDS